MAGIADKTFPAFLTQNNLPRYTEKRDTVIEVSSLPDLYTQSEMREKNPQNSDSDRAERGN